MKIVVDRLPENPKDCIFSRVTTGTRRCVHNSHICPLSRGGECPYLTEGQRVIVGVDLAQGDDFGGAVPESETTEAAPEQSAPEKRTTEKTSEKKDGASK